MVTGSLQIIQNEIFPFFIHERVYLLKQRSIKVDIRCKRLKIKIMKNLITVLGMTILFMASNDVGAQNYDNAVGLRVPWGFGATVKHFFGEKVAAEGIVNYWSRGTLGLRYTQTRIAALVEVHSELDQVLDGLQWYYGGGAFVSIWGGSFSRYYDYKSTQIGVSGVLGLDYTFADLPINVSVDWMPSVSFVGGGGFGASAGGLAVRYIF